MIGGRAGMGPAWTRGEIEAPGGEKDMGGWRAAVYTPEQQARLGVTESGEPLNQVGGGGGYKEEFTVVEPEGAPLRRTLSSESYDKMLANPNLTGDQRAQLEKMRSKRAAKENDNQVGGGGFREQFTVVNTGGGAGAALGRTASETGRRKAKARSRWRVATAVAKMSVALPMAIGIPVSYVPDDAIFAEAVEIPTAIAISPRGDLVLTPAEKMDLVKAKLCRLPPSIFREMDLNGDGYLSEDELRQGFEAMGDELTDPELKSILSIADTDGDGRVSASEFASLAETLHMVEALKAEVGL